MLFDGRRFVCWKCGSADHIGDKCREHERTFEEVFGENNDDSGTAPVSWAAIVKGKGGLSPDLTMKRDNYARQIREINEKKAKDKKDAEERKEAAEQRRAMNEETERQKDSVTGLSDNEENMILESY